jgi:hypothetical protein
MKKEKTTFFPQTILMKTLIIMLMSVVFSNNVFSEKITLKQVKTAASNWLSLYPSPLKTKLSSKIKDIIPIITSEKTVCYAINLDPEGFLLLSADTNITPVIGIIPKGSFKLDADFTIAPLIEEALSKRINEAKQFYRSSSDRNTTNRQRMSAFFTKNKQTWSSLLKPKTGNANEPANLIVPSFLKSTWDLGNINGENGEEACYNYCNPRSVNGQILFDIGNKDNYLCETFNIAVAQIMRYFEHPKKPLGRIQGLACVWIGEGHSDYGEYDGGVYHYLMGGDGNGGAYQWDLMTLSPDETTPAINRKQIGSLIHDIGFSSYVDFYPLGEKPRWFEFPNTFKETPFNYQSAFLTRTQFNLSNNNVEILRKIFIPNMQIKSPIIMRMEGDNTYGSVYYSIADGLGYVGTTPYFHINFCRMQQHNGWYNIPNVGTSYSFNTVDFAVFNIFPESEGEIICGRVTAASGEPVQNQVITVSDGNSFSKTVKSDINGSWAMVVDSSTKYNVTCINGDKEYNIETGKTIEREKYTSVDQIGNIEGLNFIVPLPPTIKASDKSITIYSVKGINPKAYNFNIWNNGEIGSISYTVKTDQSWLTCTPTSGSSTDFENKQKATINISSEDMESGSYEAVITLTDPNANQSPYEIDVTLNVLEKPYIKLASTSEDWTYNENTDSHSLNCYSEPGSNLEPVQFTVSNAGTDKSQLNFYVSSDCPWITCTPSTGESLNTSDSTDITLSFNTTELPVGNYKGVINVSDSEAYNSPCIINISLDIGPQIPTENLIASLFGGNNESHTVNAKNLISFLPDSSGLGNNLSQRQNNKMPCIKKNICGYSVKYFSGKSFLCHPGMLNTGSADLNQGQTIAISFKTSNEITKPQVLFSIGNKSSGSNVVLINSTLHINTWAPGSNQSTPITITKSVLQNTFYRLLIVSNLSDNTFKAQLNGDDIGSQTGVFEVHLNFSNLSVGNGCKTTKKAKGFIGTICDVLCYSTPLNTVQLKQIDDYLKKKYSKTFQDYNNFALTLDSDCGVGIASSGSTVNSWLDQSTSQIPFQQKNCKCSPILSNGLRLNQDKTLSCHALKFDGEDDILCSKNTPALNSSKIPYNKRSLYIVFKTGEDISVPQIIWAEGNKKTGMNICVESNQLTANAWNFKSTQGVKAWGSVSISTENLKSNTLYLVNIALNKTNNTLTGSAYDLSNNSNILPMGTATGFGALPRHSCASIGASKTTTFGCGNGSKGNYFNGCILYVLLYNDILSETGHLKVIDLITKKYN